jgi:hypothetical protein
MRTWNFFVGGYLILGMFLNASASNRLGGELKTTILEPSGNPYYVEDVVTVPKNETLIIKAGCVFLFSNFCGLDVHGNLIVEGTEKDPVIFSAINDVHYNPKAQQFANAFDWNGISIQQTSDTVRLENFKLFYSVYGIKSRNNKMIIHNGVFSENGQYNLTISESIQQVENNQPFSLNFSQPTTISDSTKKKIISLYEKKVQNKKITAFTFLGTGILAGGLDAYLFVKYWDYRQEVPIFHTPPIQRGIDSLKNKRDNFKTGAIVCAAGTGALLATALVVKLIPVKDPQKKEMKNTALYLDIAPNKAGLVLVAKY